MPLVFDQFDQGYEEDRLRLRVYFMLNYDGRLIMINKTTELLQSNLEKVDY